MPKRKNTSFRVFARHTQGFKKPPHQIWVGPRSAGKSFMALAIASLFPSEIFEISSHQSDQAFYGKAPCADTFTMGKVFFFDEGDGNKLGVRGRKGSEKANNSTDKRSTEYKEKLTAKFTKSTVLGLDEVGGRAAPLNPPAVGGFCACHAWPGACVALCYEKLMKCVGRALVVSDRVCVPFGPPNSTKEIRTDPGGWGGGAPHRTSSGRCCSSRRRTRTCKCTV